MYILGINAYHGDASAALIENGKLIAAAEEERFTRLKHCAGFPTQAVRYCLAEANIQLQDVAHIGISRNPSAHLSKKIVFAATRAAKAFAVGKQPVAAALAAAHAEPGFSLAESYGQPAGNGQRGFFRQVVDRVNNAARIQSLEDDLALNLGVPKRLIRAQVHKIEHHRAHLASSFYVSPFDSAALLSLDGFGDFISTMWAIGRNNTIEVLGQVEFPHSLGILYTATTQFLGFPHYGDEGKVMGLAPYGEPVYLDEFRHLVRTESEGQFRLDLDYFRHHSEGVEMTWDRGSPFVGQIFSEAFSTLFGPARSEGAPLTKRDSNLAASLQLRLEEVCWHILDHLYEQTGLSDLGLSGGVAYNSVMNGKVRLKSPFQRVFIQAAAGDSGTALGVCYQIHANLLSSANPPDGLPAQKSGLARTELLEGAYTGPQFSDAEICREIEGRELTFKTLDDEALFSEAAYDIAAGLVVGWFQGRMEFGPRALGNRSILVDPRRRELKEILNLRIKKRESFRPFAPSVLQEHADTYFEQDYPAPTMLMVYQIRPERRGEIPAVCHIDGSGRLQTVSPSTNYRFYALISAFYRLTGIPLVLNTSFNENEPIVCTPADALDCFQRTRIDALYIGNQVIRRTDINARELNERD